MSTDSLSLKSLACDAGRSSVCKTARLLRYSTMAGKIPFIAKTVSRPPKHKKHDFAVKTSLKKHKHKWRRSKLLHFLRLRLFLPLVKTYRIDTPVFTPKISGIKQSRTTTPLKSLGFSTVATHVHKRFQAQLEKTGRSKNKRKHSRK